MRFPVLRKAGIESTKPYVPFFSGSLVEKAALFSLQNNPPKWVKLA
jgi:hypothetical protein